MSGGRLPYRSGAVPPVVQGFQPRAVAELESLVTGGVVLSGLGGVGKTQAAAEYVRRKAGEVELVGWITATSRSNVVGGLAELYAAVTGAVVDDAERAARGFLDWCTSTAHAWLIVLDDVADPGELAGLWPQPGTTGRLVVTTRRNEPWALATDTRRMTSLGVFTERESSAYLRGVLGDVDGIDELAELLGHLPLALSQAAAYVSMRPGMSCLDYVRKWRSRALKDMFPGDWVGVDGRRDTVATTWSISIEAADQLEPEGLARPMLTLMSLLDPNGIPLSVLTSGPVLAYLSTGNGDPVDEDAAAQALGNLRRLNLIAVDNVARVHALVQQATRAQLAQDRLPKLSHVVADALVDRWPEVERDTEHAAMLRNNATALTDQYLWEPHCHPVLFRAGRSLGTSGQVHAAVPYHESLVTKAIQRLGPDHPDTLIARNNLAYWRGDAGDAVGAVQAFVELLADHLRILGPDHPRTLRSRNNLAHWRGVSGDAAGAASAFAEILTDRIRILGPDHPDTLRTRNNLAVARGEAGDPFGTASAFAELVADRIRILGPDHPDTLTARNNLASSRGQSGDPAGAAQACAELLTDQLRILGPDHPHTLATRGNLADWLSGAGDSAGALRAFTDLLADQLRVLGPDHPHTLATRNNLAVTRGQSGDPAGAAAALAELLLDRTRILGPDHPHTLATRSNLASCRGRAGDPTGAAQALAELLTDQLRTLGPDHPDTLLTRRKLSYWRNHIGLPDVV
ncbi:tetratricopeptide repeat protein [Actinokineospora diospyrosa]|uniref:Tetratricopeptide repeat-containing protein n=1 Tax=Actinokineospora diospyrosa TaxID=103728 RepID=A0ABT1IGM0_9PSEU|nr:tetratricopeptide repeat protein [Actinokineospora diospyrosa]MCP2271792.1 Tetratricopeptide repeat-containing protein [Actinokineospora diospyrosa]